MNALEGFIAPMVGATKSGEHPVHVIMSGGLVVEATSKTVTDPNGLVHHEIQGGQSN